MEKKVYSDVSTVYKIHVDHERKGTGKVMIDHNEVAGLQKRIAMSDDQIAYVRLYRIYFTPLYHFALSFVHSRQIAEEIVSDVFLQVWQNRSQLNTINNFAVYIYTCAKNHSLNCLTKNKRAFTFELNEDSLAIPSSTADPEELYITSELIKEMDRAIQQLSPRCRLIFKLIREDGLKYREVAEILNISIKTVETQIGIAMKKLGTTIGPRHTKKRIFSFNRSSHS